MIGSHRLLGSTPLIPPSADTPASLLRRTCYCARPFLAARPHASHPLVDQHQQPLSKLERNAKRAESQRLGRQLVTVQIGRQGITPNLIVALGDALAKNELVKV